MDCSDSKLHLRKHCSFIVFNLKKFPCMRCRRGGVSGDRAARQKKARAGGREEARDRKHDEKVYPIFKKRALGGAASAQGGGKRTAGDAGQRPECGPEEAGEFRRRAGAGSFRHDPG